MEQARIEPPRPLPSISLSNLGVRKRFELHFRFSIDFNGKSRTQPREASEIRRVTDAWNTPARLYPSLSFDMCTGRRRIPSDAKRIHDIPTMRDPRLPVFASTLMSMYIWTKDAIGEWRVILTLIPIRPFYQTSAGVRSVGNGRLRMRRLASLSTVSLQAIYGTRYTETRAGWHDHIRKVTLSQKKPRCRRPLGPWGVKEPLLTWNISVLDRHGAQTWN